MGPSEAALVLITSMLLPGIAILAVAFFSGSLEASEDVKYMAVIGDELPEDEPAGERGRRA